MPPDPSPRVGGAYAQLRRGDTTSREFACDDGVNRARIHGAAPPFEHALAASLQDRTIEGQPRTSRRYSPYGTCPLPTIADKLLFILTYLKQHPIQEVKEQLFGMSQSHANKWIHLLHAVLNQAFAPQELLPARNAEDLAVILAAKRTEGVPLPPLLA
jgi:Helix-turn-helix of DDE superfamily endonuclease